MKKAILFAFLIAAVATSNAQWSNTTNQFYDSLDMPVARAAGDQKNPLVIKSEPDGGYFVIWEDFRGANGNSDIYAQKYDKEGHSLWATNGVPVATGDAPDQQYSNISNGVVNYINYQSVSHAASDGNGGFYITWQVYLASPISNYGVFIQHVRSDGSRVFGSDGYGLAIPASSTQGYTQPQLIADGNGGFFIGYLSRGNYNRVVAYCYKDEGGTLKRYGGGAMHDYRKLVSQQGPGKCGPYTTFDPISYIGAESFFIFPDGQGGCGVAMALQTNSGEDFPALNRLARVKKDCHVTKDVRFNLDSNPWSERRQFFYKKDTVVTVYQLSTYSQTITCNVLVNDPVPPGQEPIIVTYVYTDYHINNQGFAALKSPVYGVEKMKAAVLPTEGNIDALLVTWNERNYINSALTNFSTKGRALAIEKYDSVPYQLSSDTLFPQLSYNPLGPAGMNRLNDGVKDVDTLIAPSGAGYFYDYSLTGSGNRAFLIASVNGLSGSSGASPFYYQEAKVIRQSADSFALKINTASDTGVVIGIGTGNDRFPFFAGDGAGNATFCYVGANGRDYVKASPVEEGGKLSWGALGLPLNSGGVSGSYYYASSPFLYMDAEGKAVVAWNDGRKTPDGYTGESVYMRHLDSLLKPNYQPPLLKTQLTIVPASSSVPGRNFAQSNPQSLAGTSNAWTIFQVPVSGPTSNTATPVAAIRDDYNLGTVSVSTYDFYNQPLRTTNGRAYLDRNYTISVTNHPAGASIHVRLIFTKAEFDSLKAHDAAIQDPGDLGVTKQPSSGVAPATYTVSANDQYLRPSAWGTIENMDGNETVVSGYYIEVVVSDFSNFFITKAAGAILPVTLQSFTVKAVDNTARLQWRTASELDNDHFDIERSADGRTFTKIGRVQGQGTTGIAQNYVFTDAAPLAGDNYYRLAQVDLNGKIDYSQIRLLSFAGQAGTLKVFPNPVRSTLHVQLPKAAPGQDALQVLDLTGLKVLVQSVPAGTLQTDADISTLVPGVYILRYGNESVKVVKQ